ncbi:hypothetical protein K2173_006358 [Erythroxylum novogranatense]|uniref:Uncharacterized protein n=1 Tax=Erythroxylum novogranatense TaxID=1862640 RepID=A0AAV8U5W1_9ROSI|nr:hypothetical protein K2173_006358 [Erythroxylum novogranatense]
MEVGDDKKKSSCMLYCCTKGFQKSLTPEIVTDKKKSNTVTSESNSIQKKPGGWRAIPYILGNETFERLATFGLFANFMVYLTRIFNLEQVAAANIMNIWGGLTNFAPLLGAFISDAYVGRFKTIAVASCFSFMGMLVVTLTAWLPNLHPPQCHSKNQILGPCQGPTGGQLGVLMLGLGLLSIGSGGIRPCSIPFGVDQFDPTTEDGLKGIKSFYNLYYTSFTVILIITSTVVVYIQDSVSWVIGFCIPTSLMLSSIPLFFIGKRVYVHVKPEGSIFSGIAEVIVASYKKRHVKLPDEVEVVGNYYDPPVKETVLTKLPHTHQYRFLNKAAMIVENDLKPDGTRANRWRLCSIQQVEEVKCLIRVIPIWVSGIIALTAILQQGTFIISQALLLDRHLGPHFQIPAGSVAVISMITVGIWLPIYDRIVVPSLRKITRHEGGITILQRMGIGIIFSILSMAVAGLVERERRVMHNSHPNIRPMSVLWLAPQLVLLGFCDSFNIIGQIEFFNQEFPEHLRSLGNAVFACSFAGASYLSSFLISTVHRVTKTRDHPDWLTNDLNSGRLDYFFFLIAVLGCLNLIYFLICASRYQYKGTQMKDKSDIDIELSSTKDTSLVDNS